MMLLLSLLDGPFAGVSAGRRQDCGKDPKTGSRDVKQSLEASSVERDLERLSVLDGVMRFAMRAREIVLSLDLQCYNCGILCEYDQVLRPIWSFSSSDFPQGACGVFAAQRVCRKRARRERSLRAIQ